jgi:uridine phosphorylase
MRKHLLDEFDPTVEAIVDPNLHIKRIEGFPETCIFAFSRKIFDKYIALDGAQLITYLHCANGKVPIYKLGDVALTLAAVGAPLCVGFAEEVIALGAKKLIFFGACGVLDESIVQDHLIVVDRALRDEGTSYHYAPPSDIISLEKHAIDVMTETLERLGYPYVKGMTWTTDAFYRETVNKTLRRKQQGCIVVDMEVASLCALAQFRKVKYAHFLYAGDVVSVKGWNPRNLSDQGFTKSDLYMEVAIEIAKNL